MLCIMSDIVSGTRIMKRRSIRYPELCDDNVKSKVRDTDGKGDRNEDVDNCEDEKERKPLCKTGGLYPSLPEHGIDYEDEDEIKEPFFTEGRKCDPGKKPVKNLEEENTPWCIILVVIVVCLVLAAIYKYCQNNNFIVNKDMGRVEYIENAIKELKRNYPQQLDLSWKVVSNSVKKHAKMSDPKSPAILLLISVEDAQCITSCVAHSLAASVAAAYHEDSFTIINGSELPKNPSEAKKVIDNKFAYTFKEVGRHTIVIDCLDNLPAESASILHAFCDHENSPYKQGIIIMTISSDCKALQNSPQAFDELAIDRLKSAWKELGEGKLDALVTRITVSVAVIQHGPLPSNCIC